MYLKAYHWRRCAPIQKTPSVNSTSSRNSSNFSKLVHSSTLGHTKSVVTGEPACGSGSQPVHRLREEKRSQQSTFYTHNFWRREHINTKLFIFQACANKIRQVTIASASDNFFHAFVFRACNVSRRLEVSLLRLANPKGPPWG